MRKKEILQRGKGKKSFAIFSYLKIEYLNRKQNTHADILNK